MFTKIKLKEEMEAEELHEHILSGPPSWVTASTNLS
jgi:hypothetical protein